MAHWRVPHGHQAHGTPMEQRYAIRSRSNGLVNKHMTCFDKITLTLQASTGWTAYHHSSKVFVRRFQGHLPTSIGLVNNNILNGIVSYVQHNELCMCHPTHGQHKSFVAPADMEVSSVNTTLSLLPNNPRDLTMPRLTQREVHRTACYRHLVYR